MNLAEALEHTRATAHGLEGRTIATVARGRPNLIKEVSGAGVTVVARNERLVPWEHIDNIVKYLYRRRTVTGADLKKDRVPGAYRGAFITALLAHCEFADASVRDGVRTLRWLD